MNNPDGDALELLKKAVVYANNSIYRQRKGNPELGSMSCVLTASLVELESMRVNIAHVGDTRLYQYSCGQMEKLSHDHSLIGYREEIGNLTEEEAMRHPQRNIISRDVGSAELSDDTSYVEVASYPLENKTQLLLCSDGLCDMITSVQMAEVLSKGMPVEEKVAGLIEAALDAGGRDNVTVIVVDIESDDDMADTEDSMTDEPIVEIQEQSAVSVQKSLFRLRKTWILIAVILIGAVALVCSQFCSEKNVESKKSADTTVVAPADSLSISDSLDQQLSLAGEEADADIHDDVSDENN